MYLRPSCRRGFLRLQCWKPRARLDFTVLGPAVNEASRIAAMCRSVDQLAILLSAAFADVGEMKHRQHLLSVGRYALRGVSQPRELFTIDLGSAIVSACDVVAIGLDATFQDQRRPLASGWVASSPSTCHLRTATSAHLPWLRSSYDRLRIRPNYLPVREQAESLRVDGGVTPIGPFAEGRRVVAASVGPGRQRQQR